MRGAGGSPRPAAGVWVLPQGPWVLAQGLWVLPQVLLLPTTLGLLSHLW